MSIQDHRNEHNCIRNKDRQDSLPPVHTTFDQRTGQHIGRNTKTHADPQGSIVPGTPFPSGYRNGSEVFVNKRTFFYSRVVHSFSLELRVWSLELSSPGD